MIVDKYNPEIFFISEAELDLTIVPLYNIDNYLLVTSDGCPKARLACYILQNSSFRHKPDLLKSAPVDIIPLVNDTSRIIGVYRPFKLRDGLTKRVATEKFFSSLYDLTNSDSKIWIGGDFNINLDRQSFETSKLQELIDDLALQQLVHGKTWERVVTQLNGDLVLRSSQIDHVFTNVQESNLTIEDKWTSDHKLLVLSIPSLFPRLDRQKVSVRSWRNFNTANLNISIQERLSILESDALSSIHSSDSDTLNEAIGGILKDSFDQICPLRVVRTSRPSDITCDTVERIKKKRKRTLQKYNKTKNSSLLEIIHRLDIRLKVTIRNTRKSIVQQKLKSGNAKSFWNTIKHLQGENIKSGPLELKIDECLTQDPVLVANSFATFFEDKVSRLSQNTNSYNWVRSDTSLLVTETDLDNAIKSLKSKMCSGHDNVPLKLIKYGVPSIKSYVLKLMQLAMNNIPSAWKTAVITPLHKSGAKQNVENYRPISNLVSMSKIFEKIVLAKLDVTHPNIEGQAQHGFRRYRGTLTAQLELQHWLSSALDDSLLVSVYSIDMSAAFDLLRPNIFHESSNLNEPLLNVTMDFLSGRNFQVKVGDHLSSKRDLHVGCVQGSVLGPKLFNIYCKNVAKSLPPEAKIVIYADDSYVVNVDTDFSSLQNKTKDCITKHTEALRKIGMIVNSNKTELLFLTRNKLLSGKVLNLDFEGSTIHSQSQIKALGTIFSSDLSWHKHIDYAIKKSNHIVKRIRFLSRWLDKKDLLQLVTTQYFPVIFYSSPLWTNCLDWASLKRLNSAHYRAIRAALRIRDVRSKSRKVLDELSSRATPSQWLNYSLASTVIRLYTFSDTNIAATLRDSSYINDRLPLRAKFFDRSKYKIGRQSLQNRIGQLFAKISFDWLNPLSCDALRINLKKEFFK